MDTPWPRLWAVCRAKAEAPAVYIILQSHLLQLPLLEEVVHGFDQLVGVQSFEEVPGRPKLQDLADGLPVGFARQEDDGNLREV